MRKTAAQVIDEPSVRQRLMRGQPTRPERWTAFALETLRLVNRRQRYAELLIAFGEAEQAANLIHPREIER